jgi:hypothetical protein
MTIKHPVKDPAGGLREPRERGVARGRLAPSGEDPAHPAPLKGRAGFGGLAATAPSSRPVAKRRSRGSPVVKVRRLADRAAVPRRPPGEGGGPLTAARVSAQGPQRSRLSGCHVIQRERPQPFPGIPTPVPAGLRPPEPRWRPLRSWFPTRGSQD